MTDHFEDRLRAALTARAGELPAGAEERLRGADYRPRSYALRPPVALAAGAGVAAATGLVVALVGLGAGSSPAFAGWNPAPTQPAAGQTDSARAMCTAQLGRAAQLGRGGGPLQSSVPADGWTTALVDTRGPFTAMILRNGAATATCFNGPLFTTITVGDGQYGQTAGSVHIHGGLASGVVSGAASGGGSAMAAVGFVHSPAGPISAASQAHLVTSADQPYTLVQGQVAGGATSVTLQRTDGSDVQATVAAGSFVAWWPGSTGADSASVTGSSGTSTQQLNFASPPGVPCSGPPKTATTNGQTVQIRRSCSGGAIDGGGPPPVPPATP